MKRKQLLVYGYGNPGRQDDGLGPALIRMLEVWLEENPVANLKLDSNYQLNIEDAETISESDIVVFVDATIEELDNFAFTEVKPSEARVEFTMHAVSPAFVLDLCNKVFGKKPETWLLRLKGYSWDFIEELSAPAQQNLQLAFDHLMEFLEPKLCFLTPKN
jgi:hydrogenase maturation protease